MPYERLKKMLDIDNNNTVRGYVSEYVREIIIDMIKGSQ